MGYKSFKNKFRAKFGRKTLVQRSFKIKVHSNSAGAETVVHLPCISVQISGTLCGWATFYKYIFTMFKPLIVWSQITMGVNRSEP